MSNEDNPYYTLLELMAAQGSINNPIPFLLGKITSVEPLLIQVNDLQLEREDLLISTRLLDKSKKVKIIANKVEGTVTGSISGTCSGVDGGSVSGSIVDGKLNGLNMSEGNIELLDPIFTIGDSVILLMSSDQQTFVLLDIVR